MSGLAGCTVPHSRRLDPSQGGPPLTPSSLPSWSKEAASWEKLDHIESWIATESVRSDPFWRVEAELQLAEGRMAFASDTDDPEVARRRRRNARTGFLRVRTDPEASSSQINRATAGLEGSMNAGPREAVSPNVRGVLSRQEWGARQPNPNNLTRATSDWSFITIHHSAIEGVPPMGTSKADAVEALRMVQRWHMDGRNYGDVGYHFFIDPAGRVWQGRDMAWQGAHAGQRNGRNNNPGNIGVCLLGNFDEERPTQAALNSMSSLVQRLEKTYSIPHNGVGGHSDWTTTICPGRHLLPHVRRLSQ